MLSATLQEGLSELRDRRQDPVAAPEEENGARRAGPAHRAVSGAALEDRARPLVPDAADAAAHRARLQRRPRVLLRRRARTSPSGAVVRKGQRVQLPDRPGAGTGRIASSRSTTRRPSGDSIPTTLSSCRCRARRLRPHDHPGVEFIYALQGTLSVQHRWGRARDYTPATRCISIRACRTATGAAAAGSAARSS